MSKDPKCSALGEPWMDADGLEHLSVFADSSLMKYIKHVPVLDIMAQSGSDLVFDMSCLDTTKNRECTLHLDYADILYVGISKATTLHFKFSWRNDIYYSYKQLYESLKRERDAGHVFRTKCVEIVRIVNDPTFFACIDLLPAECVYKVRIISPASIHLLDFLEKKRKTIIFTCGNVNDYILTLFVRSLYRRVYDFDKYSICWQGDVHDINDILGFDLTVANTETLYEHLLDNVKEEWFPLLQLQMLCTQ